MVMTVMVIMSAVAVTHVPDRHKLDACDSGGDVQSGLALQADGLQPIGILRTTDEEIAAETNPDRRVGADAAIVAGKFAASKPVGRRIHGPGELGLIGEAEIDAEPVDGCDVWFGTAAFALEYAFEVGH